MTDTGTPVPAQSSSARRRRGLALALGLTLCALAAYVWIVQDSQPSAQADRTYDQAMQLAESGDRDRARELLAGILEQTPGHVRSRILNGQLLWEQGHARQARDQWAQVDDDAGRESAIARYLEGSAWLEENRAIPAETSWNRAVELDPGYLPPLQHLAALYSLQLRSADLRRSLQQIAEVRDLSVVELAREILADSVTGETTASLQQLQQYYTTDPADITCRIAAARIQMRQAENQAALQLLESASTQNDPQLLAAQALALTRLGQHGEAGRILTRLVDEPASPVLWRARGELLDALGHRPASIAALLMAARMSPFDVGLFHQIGLSLGRRSEDELAQAFLERASRLDELERDAFLMLRSANRPPQLVGATVLDIAENLIAIGRPSDAGQWLQQGRALVPGDPRLSDLAAQLSSAPGDSWEQLLSRAAKDYPRQLARGDLLQPLPADNSSPNDSTSAGARIELTDVAKQLGIDFTYDNGAAGFKWIIESIGGGVAVLDYDADGLPDLFFPQGRPLRDSADSMPAPDRLYRNCGDDGFRDVTQAAGLLSDDYSIGVAVGDVNNDGLPDLFVNNLGPNVLYINLGDGCFRSSEIEALADRDDAGASAALADFDGDGNLDLFVVNYVTDWDKVCVNARGEYSTCVPHQLDAAQDRLLRNLGDGRFEDVTDSSGIVLPDGRGLGLLASDLDRDGRIDVYVANDGSPNFLLQNQSTPGEIRFREQGLVSGAAVGSNGRAEAGMGIAAGDLNSDGQLDLFVTNFFQEPNRLYLSQGGLLFRDATGAAQLTAASLPLLGFGTQALDLDLDGDLDLIVANGDIDDYSQFGRPWKMPTQLFVNEGGVFRDASAAAGAYFAQVGLGRGVAILDFNRDARPDVIVVHQDRPAALLRNDTSAPAQGLSLRLVGSNSNRDAIGARVTLRQGDRRQTGWLNGGNGFCAANERRLFFAVDPQSPIDSIHVRWPSGAESEFTSVPSSGRLILLEGEPGRALREP